METRNGQHRLRKRANANNFEDKINPPRPQMVLTSPKAKWLMKNGKR